MPIPTNPESLDVAPRFPRWQSLVLAPVLYLAALSAATYPAVTHLQTALPSALPDPLMHLWVMTWYKSCLLEGRAPLVCPDIQYPVGAPLGHFSPMHLQALLYLPLSSIIHNDTLCYNLLWFGGFLFTALGTYALAWYVVKDAACAWIAGLLAMLSGPMMMHAHAHLEIIYAGGFPLFLLTWMRLIDRPSPVRLVSAALAFLVMTMGAAYYMVLAIPPAAFYVVWWFLKDARGNGNELAWRVKWLAGFALLCTPVLIFLFAPQLWAMAQGFSMRRERSQFDYYSASFWSYFAPSKFQRLGRAIPYDIYFAAGQAGAKIGESMSYLGVVTIALLLVAVVRRARARKIGFLWAVLGLVVVLSMGSRCDIGSTKVPLPGGWLWRYMPLFQLTRNPARFNLFAASCAAVVAAAGLRSLIAERSRIGRVCTVACVASLAVVDLSVHTFTGYKIPRQPACYARLTAHGDRPALLEIPLTLSQAPWVLTSSCAYWQSFHHCRTSAGYSGHDNEQFDNEVFAESPFSFEKLADPTYLANSDRADFGVARDAVFDDYVWLYMQMLEFEYVILHKWRDSMREAPVRLDRVAQRLAPALVWEDRATAVYDPARLPLPRNPIAVCESGWLRRGSWRGERARPIGRQAEVLVYSPDADLDLEIALEAEAFRSTRTVRVVAGNTELVRWTVFPGSYSILRSPPFRLPEGITRLTIRSDGEERPRSAREAIAEGEMRPYSLRVSGLWLTTVDSSSIAARGRRGAGSVTR
jgi:hypothetical protein